MEILPSRPNYESNHPAPPVDSRSIGGGNSRENTMLETVEDATASTFNLGDLFRRYWLLLMALIILGASAGFTSVVLSSPRYKTRLLLEIQSVNEAFAKGSMDAMSFDATEVGIQTQINILRSGSFLRRGAERVQSETVPLAPTGRDLFSRLRERVNPATRDPLENARRGLNTAVSTFDARPINRTRLIELSCESTSPDVAAQFLNSMAAEFKEDTTRSRMQASQKTSEWISAQIEETKSKLQESEERLREFVQASGNLFAGQDSTLDDTKLSQLKSELAKIQSERIARQTKYELVLKSPPESLPDVLDDTNLRSYQQQISVLKREKAVLETTFTSKHEKVRKVDVQLTMLEKTYQSEVASILKRIQNDFDSALRHEKLLTSAYSGQSQRVGSSAGKAAQYNSIKREVETLRQMYQSLWMQSNQSGMSGSVPVDPIRIVEPSNVPETPYKPQPIMNIASGTFLGLAFGVGIVFLRERSDRSIKSPGSTRRLLNTPELGVIPNLYLNGNGTRKPSRAAKLATAKPGTLSLDGDVADPETALISWQNAPSFLAESFRGTLASILRNQPNGKADKVILVTSPGPGEGKTTVVQNLGIALAETGRKVLLVDADFRRPHLHHRFGLPNDWSLVDLLSQKIPLDEYSPDRLGVSTGYPGLSLLPNRATHENVAKLLYSPRLRAIFEALTEGYDMVLVDAPPILDLADTRIIAPLTDALILVLRSGITHRESAVEAYRRILNDGLLLLGTILTDCESSTSGKRPYYYDYVNDGRA
jgi:succinoglycan biosynthesis transport protein ExoP